MQASRYIPLKLDPRHAQAVFVRAPRGKPRLASDEVIVDAYTGAIRQRVHYGDLKNGSVNLIPFILRLHYSLAAGP